MQEESIPSSTTSPSSSPLAMPPPPPLPLSPHSPLPVHTTDHSPLFFNFHVNYIADSKHFFCQLKFIRQYKDVANQSMKQFKISFVSDYDVQLAKHLDGEIIIIMMMMIAKGDMGRDPSHLITTGDLFVFFLRAEVY